MGYQNQVIAIEGFHQGQMVLCPSVRFPFPLNSRSDLWIFFVGHFKPGGGLPTSVDLLVTGSLFLALHPMLRWALRTPSPFGKVLAHFRFAGTQENSYLLGS